MPPEIDSRSRIVMIQYVGDHLGPGEFDEFFQTIKSAGFSGFSMGHRALSLPEQVLQAPLLLYDTNPRDNIIQ